MLRTTANPTPAAKEKTQKPKAKNALARKACFLETRVWEKILNCWRCAFFNSAASRTSARENAFRYDEVASGSIIYTYVGGNPLRYTDPTGKIAFLPGVVGGVIGGISAGLGYYASGAPIGSLGYAVVSGAVVGAAAAYVPASWGVYGALAAGTFAGAGGDVAGQYIGQKAAAEASGQCTNFNWNWKETAVQGVVGGISGGVGYGGAATAAWLNSLIPALNESAVGAGVSGITQMGANLPIPADPYGGYHP